MSVRQGLDNGIINSVSITTNSNLVKSVWMSEVYPHKGTLLYVLCYNESLQITIFQRAGEQKNKPRGILQWDTSRNKKKQTSTGTQRGWVSQESC